MKQLFFSIALMLCATLSTRAQNEIDNDIFNQLEDKAIVLSEGTLIKDQKVKKYVSDFTSTNGSNWTYRKNFGVEVNASLDYEVGELQTEESLFHVMFLKTKSKSSKPKIEFFVIYKAEDSADQTADISARRNEWMQLCNAHQADDLVKKIYTSEAYYYNRGRLLIGADALRKEYSYMNSEGYSLKLTPKHLVFPTPDIAFEIGRCSGSYPLPYMLLWERQRDNSWQILMDSNY